MGLIETQTARANIAYCELMSRGGRVALVEVINHMECRRGLPVALWIERTWEAKLGDRSALGWSERGAALALLGGELFDE